MSNEDVVIRYSIDDIIECSKGNDQRLAEMKDYFCDNRIRDSQISQILLGEMANIVKMRMDNINPNDASLMSYIREYLNKMCSTNIDATIDKLKILNYSTREHFELLANELILKSINDAMGYKGIETTEITTTEICVKISQYFYPFCLEINGNDVSFGSVFANLCSKYFKKFTQISHGTKENINTAFMNKFNQQRVNNYKGLINLIGLMYIEGLFPNNIVMSCFNQITKLVIDSNLSQEECDNYFWGFDKLVNHFCSKYETNNDINTNESSPSQTPTTQNDDFADIRDKLQTMINSINTKSQKDNNKTNSIRRYSLNILKITNDRLNKIK